jgi:hypothetical protein
MSISTDFSSHPDFMTTHGAINPHEVPGLTPIPVHRELKLARAIGGGKVRRDFVPPPCEGWDVSESDQSARSARIDNISGNSPESSPMMTAIIDAEFATHLEPLLTHRKLLFNSNLDSESEDGDDFLNASEITRKPQNVMNSDDHLQNDYDYTPRTYHSASEQYHLDRIAEKKEKINRMINKEELITHIERSETRP